MALATPDWRLCRTVIFILWMGDGFLQLYKRLEAGSLSWPRTSEEAADLTEEQFRYLMIGLNPLNPKVREVTPQKPT